MQKRYVQEIICQIRHEGSPSPPRSSFTGAALLAYEAQSPTPTSASVWPWKAKRSRGFLGIPRGAPGQAPSLSLVAAHCNARPSSSPLLTQKDWDDEAKCLFRTAQRLRYVGQARAEPAPHLGGDGVSKVFRHLLRRATQPNPAPLPLSNPVNSRGSSTAAAAPAPKPRPCRLFCRADWFQDSRLPPSIG